ncbi:hypothetical protein [Stenotrophomonas sp. B1-1]|uniref:DUF6959 family protein n=1 Tax=Stenotrophomonas sp. B1-1 TaxID=2710648 RepID=UPI0013DAC6AF|nr:hypothetical protein [Stenotrophomonas sp. B1-1]
MKKMMSISVYGEPGNNATVHFPCRRNPAVAMQSDTLHGLIADLKHARRSLANGDAVEAMDELDGVLERLKEMHAGMINDVRLAGDPDGTGWPAA